MSTETDPAYEPAVGDLVRVASEDPSPSLENPGGARVRSSTERVLTDSGRAGWRVESTHPSGDAVLSKLGAVGREHLEVSLASLAPDTRLPDSPGPGPRPPHGVDVLVDPRSGEAVDEVEYAFGVLSRASTPGEFARAWTRLDEGVTALRTWVPGYDYRLGEVVREDDEG